jgi:pyruvate dehydrogenase E2 component (dihydrolipoamide acetyltransferase)
MGLEVTEATITAIHVAPGTHVDEGQTLIEVETDKAVTEVAATRSGTVEEIAVSVGDTIEIGATLVLISDGADVAEGADTEAAPREGGWIRAAPVARRAAERLGISLATVNGTGPGGRITLGDVEAVAKQKRAAQAISDDDGAGGPRPATSGDAEPMSPTRRSVARRMSTSAQIPQFALVREIDASWLVAEKERLAAAPGGAALSVNDLLASALAETVQRHRDLAGSYVDGGTDGHPMIRRAPGVDIGIAVATDRGLLVPVIRRMHERPLREVAEERARLVAAARAGRLTAEEMTGATVTLSNLGAFGVDRFTAMINPGEAAILAVGRVVDRVLPRERGIVVAPTLTLTLTLDHRVIDGAAGGAALAELATLLEGDIAWKV